MPSFSTHMMRNTILSMENTEGIRLEDPIEVQQEILGYFTNLLGTTFGSRVDARGILGMAISKPVPEDMRFGLIAPVKDLEIVAALKSIKSDKAPAPNGINSTLKKKKLGYCWARLYGCHQILLQQWSNAWGLECYGHHFSSKKSLSSLC